MCPEGMESELAIVKYLYIIYTPSYFRQQHLGQVWSSFQIQNLKISQVIIILVPIMYVAHDSKYNYLRNRNNLVYALLCYPGPGH